MIGCTAVEELQFRVYMLERGCVPTERLIRQRFSGPQYRLRRRQATRTGLLSPVLAVLSAVGWWRDLLQLASMVAP